MKQIVSLENKIKKEYGNIAGIMVLKDDHAVYENYFNQCSEKDPIHIFSVTKSIISMLFGIALDKGCIKNLDEKVIDFFPDYQIRKGEKTIRHITIRHLLTMTAPYKFKWNPYPKYFSSEDWVKSSLDLLGGSGTIGNFRYAPVIGIDILSGILINTTGESVLKFAQDNLFPRWEFLLTKIYIFKAKKNSLIFINRKVQMAGLPTQTERIRPVGGYPLQLWIWLNWGSYI